MDKEFYAKLQKSNRLTASLAKLKGMKAMRRDCLLDALRYRAIVQG